MPVPSDWEKDGEQDSLPDQIEFRIETVRYLEHLRPTIVRRNPSIGCGLAVPDSFPTIEIKP